MKYFNNYPYTLETLKKEFRAHCLNLHPDHGGDEAQFKNMMAEYYKVLQDLTGTAAQIRAFIQGLQHGLNTRTA